MTWFWALPAAMVAIGAVLVLVRAVGVVDDAKHVVRSVEAFRRLQGDLALLRVERVELAERLREHLRR